MSMFTAYNGLRTRGPSLDLWSDLQNQWIETRPDLGLHHYDDFSLRTVLTPTNSDLYNVYTGAGVTIGPANLQGGGLLISGNAASGAEGTLQAGNGGLVISPDPSIARKLWFESRLSKPSIADNGLAYFVGLMATGGAATGTLTTAGVVAANKSYIGFQVQQVPGAQVDFVYANATGAQVVRIPNVAKLTQTTGQPADYIKLGFKFDPINPRILRVWVDGYEYVLDWVKDADVAAATFPAGVVMAPILTTKTGSAATAAPVNLSWWRWAQLSVDPFGGWPYWWGWNQASA